MDANFTILENLTQISHNISYQATPANLFFTIKLKIVAFNHTVNAKKNVLNVFL